MFITTILILAPLGAFLFYQLQKQIGIEQNQIRNPRKPIINPNKYKFTYGMTEKEKEILVKYIWKDYNQYIKNTIKDNKYV